MKKYFLYIGIMIAFAACGGGDDAGGSEFHAEPLSQAYQKSHHHGQYGKQQFVLHACQSARESDCRMEKCKDVYYPAYLDFFHHSEL